MAGANSWIWGEALLVLIIAFGLIQWIRGWEAHKRHRGHSTDAICSTCLGLPRLRMYCLECNGSGSAHKAGYKKE